MAAVVHARYILQLRSNIGSGSPSKGKGFYSFEEDLPHHIREALVIISTGTTMSFFANPYVTDWLRRLDPAHRPIYRQKFLRLLRVILFILVSVCLQVMHCDVSVAVTDIIILVF